MDTKNIVIGTLAVLALLVGSWAVLKPSTSSPTVQPLGALPGPNISSPFLCFGSSCTWKANVALHTATTTPCAIAAPLGTSTLAFSNAIVTTSTSTQTVWTVAKASSPYATTTPLVGNYTLSSGVQGSMPYFASSTVATVDPNNVFYSSTSTPQYVVWGVAGVTPADPTLLAGRCQASFKSL